MIDKMATLDEALEVAQRLSPLDKLRLLQRVASTLKGELFITPMKPLQTFKGILAHLGPGPSDEDIEESRCDMMKNFPRGDF